VKVMQRRATIAVALTLGMSAPAALSAQASRNGPDANTPRLLVAVFASSDRATGVQAADAIRNRVQSATNVRTLYIIPKTDITNYLESSGYKADSALGPTDLKELAKLLRADEVLGGTVTRTATGMKIEPRLMLARDPSLAQPLPAVEAATAADAARQIERSLADARKQLVDHRACENHIRDRAYDKAIAAANGAIVKYPNATLARLCLAEAFRQMKASPDSILRVTAEIRRIDPKNSPALRLAFAAYQDKGDAENSVRTLVAWLALEPTNQTLQGQIVSELAKLGKPSVAIPIVDTLLAQNPGDPQLLRQRWQLLLAAAAGADSAAAPGYYAQSVAAGEEMVRSDTTLADSVYYERQIIAANRVTPPRGAEFAARAVQKYPNNVGFWMSRANAERKAGQSQMALESIKRAIAIDPKTTNANLFLAQVYLDLNQADSAVTVARRAVASGEDPKTWGAFLLAPTQQTFNAAQQSKSTEQFQRALTLAQESYKLSPSSTAKFYSGAAAFFVGADAYQQAQAAFEQAQKTKNAREKSSLMAKACPLARTAQDMMLVTQTDMPVGGAVDAATARTLLGYVSQFAPAAEQMIKQACK
jgi:tetratricopeptide (TPR) repeat protein